MKYLILIFEHFVFSRHKIKYFYIKQKGSNSNSFAGKTLMKYYILNIIF